jgi:hypothetical protein
MNNKVKVLILLIVLGALGGVVGYKMYNKPHENIESKGADFSLTADELMQEFEANEQEALKKYKDQLIELSGTVEGTNKSENGGVTVLFVNNGTSMGNVKAGLQAESAEQAASLENGASIKVKGRLTGSNKLEEMGINILDIELSRCVIVE